MGCAFVVTVPAVVAVIVPVILAAETLLNPPASPVIIPAKFTLPDLLTVNLSTLVVLNLNKLIFALLAVSV